MEDKKVQELANTLKDRGLAASMADALEKAKNIMYGIAPTPTTVDKPKIQKPIERENSDKIENTEKDISSLEHQQDNFQQKFNPENPNYDIGKEKGTLGEMMEKFGKKSEESQQPIEKEQTQPRPVQTQAESQQPTEPSIKPQQPIEQEKEEQNFIGTMDEDTETFYGEDPFQETEPQQPVQQPTSPPTQQPQQQKPIEQEEEQEEELPLTQDLLKEEEEEEIQPTQQQPTSPPTQQQEPIEQEEKEEEQEEKKGLTKEEKEKTDLSKIFNFGNR